MQCQTSVRLPKESKSSLLDKTARMTETVMTVTTVTAMRPTQKQSRIGKKLSPTLNLTKTRLPLLLEQGARTDLTRIWKMKHMVAAAVMKEIEINPQTRTIPKNTQKTKNKNRREQVALVLAT